MAEDSNEPTTEEVLGFGDDTAGIYVPRACDLFPEYSSEAIKAKIAKNEDPRIRWVSITRLIEGKHIGIPGSWPAEDTSRKWLIETHGPGQYVIHGKNLSNVYVTRSVIKVEWPPSAQPVPQNGGAGPIGSSAVMDRVLEALLMKAINPAPAPVDPMREAVASMVSLMSLQITAMGEQKKNPDEGITAKLLELLIAQKNTPREPAPKALVQGGSMQEMLALLQFGMKLRDQMGGNGNGKADPKEPGLVELVTGVTESIGPAAVALVAQAVLPPDKAQSVVDVIEAHMKARHEEARNVPVETEGTAIG